MGRPAYSTQVESAFRLQILNTGGEKKDKTLPVIWWYDVCCSPFEVEVGAEAGLQKVRAWGPGLKTGMVGKSADFVVEAINTEVGTLGETQKRYFSGKNMIF